MGRLSLEKMKIMSGYNACLVVLSLTCTAFAITDDEVTVKVGGNPYVCKAEEVKKLPEVCERPTAICEGAAFDNEVEASENSFKLPAYIYCENVKALVKCFGDVIIPTCEAFVENVRGVLDSVTTRLHFMEEHCLCNNTETDNYNYYYQNCDDPCTAQPCLNGGTCISKEIGKETDPHELHDDYYYDYYYYESSSSKQYEFVGCECQPPFMGEFCQTCDSTCLGSLCNYTCREFANCNCPEGVAGPFCNLECKDIHHHPEVLVRPCIQYARDLYFLTSYQAPIMQLLLISECLAVSAVHCYIDAIPFLTKLGYWPSFTFADVVLSSGSTTLRGKIPFDLSILENSDKKTDYY